MVAFRKDIIGPGSLEYTDRRRSGVHPASPVTSPSISDLRDRYSVLIAAREHAPDRLTPRALYIFNLHEVIALRHGFADGEDIYGEAGGEAREELLQAAPEWFED